MTRTTRCVNALMALALTAVAATSAPAFAETRTICTYDPAGKSGEYFKLLDEFAVGGEELVKRGIEQANDDRKTVHRLHGREIHRGRDY